MLILTLIVPIFGVLLLAVIILSVVGLLLGNSFRLMKTMADMHTMMDFMHDNTIRFMSTINSLNYTHTMVSHDISLINKSINNMANSVNSIKGLNSIIDNLETIRDSTQEVVESAIETLDIVVCSLDAKPGQDIANIADLLRNVSKSLKKTIPDPDDTGVFDNREEEVEERESSL